MKTQESILNDETKKRENFDEARQMLFESKFVNFINLKLLAINSIVLTGGITKVLNVEEIEMIIAFFYKKILTSDHNPVTVLDSNYDIWTLGAREEQ